MLTMQRAVKNHLPLGTGEINISEKFSLAREHNCRIVLETKTIAGLKQSVENLGVIYRISNIFI